MDFTAHGGLTAIPSPSRGCAAAFRAGWTIKLRDRLLYFAGEAGPEQCIALLQPAYGRAYLGNLFYLRPRVAIFHKYEVLLMPSVAGIEVMFGIAGFILDEIIFRVVTGVF